MPESDAGRVQSQVSKCARSNTYFILVTKIFTYCCVNAVGLAWVNGSLLQFLYLNRSIFLFVHSKETDQRCDVLCFRYQITF